VEILVCPGCRTRTAERLDVRTLDRVGDTLACACGRSYPIVDNVPIVLGDPAAYLAAETTVVERDLAPELPVEGPDEAPVSRLYEHLSIYMDNHWGDGADPPPDGPGAGIADAIIAKLAELPHCGLAVELGCSVGRIVAELARRADHVVGLELHLGAIRRARRMLAGEAVTYARRVVGREYTLAIARAGDLATPATLLCGDALDPPLLPGVYDRVVALNLIDSVRDPYQLLSVVDGLCAPGGELILTSPFSWQTSITEHAFGGDDPASALQAILTTSARLGARYEIADSCDLPWTLRRDSRSAATYRIHYIRARKLPGPRTV
jgi:uncharacterized protein YbaR (Trm112 family)/SAM-dependent methyltransferase